MPSMIVAEGSGMVSAGNICFSNSVSRALCSSFSLSRLHWRASTTMARVVGKGHRSSGDGGSLLQGPCGQIDSCQLVELRCLSCLQKSSFGYVKTSSASSQLFCHGTEPLVFRRQTGLA